MTCVRAFVALVAALAVSSLSVAPAPAAAEGLIPHIDPLNAVKAMRHGTPTQPPPPQPPALSANDQRQRQADALIAAEEKAQKERFQNAGPWELIAAQVFGVFAKPEFAAPAHAPEPVHAPTPAPTPAPPVPPTPTPAVHSPVHVLPIPLKTDAPSDAQHSKAAAPATAVPAPASAAPEPAAATTPAAVASSPTAPAVELQNGKPVLSRDTVMRLIRRYTDAIARFEHDRAQQRQQHIAAAAKAWADANPPKHHAPPSELSHPLTPASPPHPTPHHRLGVATHKMPPPPTHGRAQAMQTPSDTPQPHTQFVLKFTGVCVDNRTAAALGKHHNPHHRQPLRHHLQHHRRGFHSDAEPSREVPWCSLKAQSQEIITRIHPRSGVDMSVSRMVGSVARLDLFDVSILSESEFVARGNLSFGSTRHRPHSVVMESAGSARVFKFETGSRAFAASFQVTGGSGGFEGHRGTLTLNGVLKSMNRVEAFVTGVLYPPEDLTARRTSGLKRSPFYRPLPPQPQSAKPEAEDDDSDDDDEEDDAEGEEPVKPHRTVHLRP